MHKKTKARSPSIIELAVVGLKFEHTLAKIVSITLSPKTILYFVDPRQKNKIPVACRRFQMKSPLFFPFELVARVFEK